MSSATIAARPTSGLPRVPLAFVIAALILAIGLGAVIGARAVATTAPAAVPAETGNSIKHHSGVPAPAKPTMADYRQVVSNLAAAEARHDYASQFRFKQELSAVLTPEVIGTIYQTRAKLAADLEWANEHHDAHNRATLSRQLAALCGADAVRAELAFCN
jgi:hypothetical protein